MSLDHVDGHVTTEGFANVTMCTKFIGVPVGGIPLYAHIIIFWFHRNEGVDVKCNKQTI